jgi:hypothetical protein
MPELVDLRDADNKLVSRVTRAQAEAALAARLVDLVGTHAVKYIRLRVVRGPDAQPRCTPRAFLQHLEIGRTWAFTGTTGAEATVASPVTRRAERRPN